MAFTMVTMLREYENLDYEVEVLEPADNGCRCDETGLCPVHDVGPEVQ